LKEIAAQLGHLLTTHDYLSAIRFRIFNMLMYFVDSPVVYQRTMRNAILVSAAYFEVSDLLGEGFRELIVNTGLDEESVSADTSLA